MFKQKLYRVLKTAWYRKKKLKQQNLHENFIGKTTLHKPYVIWVLIKSDEIFEMSNSEHPEHKS